MTALPTPPEALPMPLMERSDELIARCEGLWPEWTDLKHRVERTAGLDRQLSNKYDAVYKKMDSYLAELFALTVFLGLEDGTAV